MNNDLTQEADPQEVIKELKAAYQQVYEENKRLRADIEQDKKTEAVAFMKWVFEQCFINKDGFWYEQPKYLYERLGICVATNDNQLYDYYLKSTQQLKTKDNG